MNYSKWQRNSGLMAVSHKLIISSLCFGILAALTFAAFYTQKAKAEGTDTNADYIVYLPAVRSAGESTPPPPPPPPPADERFFIEPEKMIGTPGLAIDQNGGMHMAYRDWLPDAEHPQAIYAYCAPTADCASEQNWQQVTLPSDLVQEVQIAVTSTGKPRMLIRATSTIYTAIAPGKEYYYAACDQNCLNANNWTVTYLLYSHGTSIFDSSDSISPQRYFALDPQGRPRFVYLDNNYFYSEPDHTGAYYMFCDTNCNNVANWHEGEITEWSPYDHEVLEYPSLAFTTDGRPRIVGNFMPLNSSGEGNGIYYFECDTNCGDHANWHRLGLYMRGNGTDPSWDLELDSANRPRFVFYVGEGSEGTGWEKLHYVWCNSNCLNANNWDSSELGLPEGTGKHPDLEMDSQGKPRVAYIMGSGGGVGYSWCTGSCETQQPQWHHEIIDTATDMEEDFPVPLPPTCDVGLWDSIAPVMAFGPDGQPKVVFESSYNGRCWIDVDPSDNNPPEYIYWEIRHAVRVLFPQ